MDGKGVHTLATAPPVALKGIIVARREILIRSGLQFDGERVLDPDRRADDCTLHPDHEGRKRGEGDKLHFALLNFLAAIGLGDEDCSPM